MLRSGKVSPWWGRREVLRRNGRQGSRRGFRPDSRDLEKARAYTWLHGRWVAGTIAHTRSLYRIRRLTVALDPTPRRQTSGEIPTRPQVLAHLIDLDQRAFERFSTSRSPGLDAAMTIITDASRHSRLPVLFAGALSVLGGATGRRCAGEALVAIGVTTTAANAIVESAGQRRPPGSAPGPVLPSGRTASATAFATVVGHHVPFLALPLNAFAAAVGASRVYNGIHHPRNVVLGWLFGKGVGIAVLRIGGAVEARRTRSNHP